MTEKLTAEDNRILNFLASMPGGHTTADKVQTKRLLLYTGGTLTSCGGLYDIKSTHLGAGVYRLFLQRFKHPAAD